MTFPLKNPKPDFESLDKVIRGEKRPERVHFVEELVDPEIVNYITQNMMDEDFPELDETWASMGSNSHMAKKIKAFTEGKDFLLIDGEPDVIRLRRDINFYYRMGFDYVPDLLPWGVLGILLNSSITNAGITGKGVRQTDDTAQDFLSRGMRNWQEESSGFIKSWDDFERIEWDRVSLERIGIEEYLDLVEENLPEGMKIPVVGCLFDPGVIGSLFGLEDFCYFLYEQPDLVRAVVDRYGQLNYELYRALISHDSVGFMWHADDLAYHSQTMISPAHLREYIFPWFKKYAQLAHDAGKTTWLHCCGNIYDLMDDLIDDIGIDAKHSFEDNILPVTEFQGRYGDRIASLGGIDMDKLCRMPEEQLRGHCRSVLDTCMARGRYVYGSGNTIANYVPLANYFAMIEEGYNYAGPCGR